MCDQEPYELYTPEEIFAMMAEKNDKLGLLRETFELEFE